MRKVKDFLWKHGMTIEDMVDKFGSLGFQSLELYEASEVIINMKKSGARIFLTFTSNMVTSGLRGFFAQLIKLGMADVIVTTSGSIEEDIMKAVGEDFEITSFNADDVHMHEKGENRIGNLLIRNESYMRFEDRMSEFLKKIYEKNKKIDVSELLKQLGLMIKDENSFLYRAAKNNVPVFCPGIADSAIGFHLFMFQQKHPDFIVDTIGDMKNAVLCSSHDEKKGLIALGGEFQSTMPFFQAC